MRRGFACLFALCVALAALPMAMPRSVAGAAIVPAGFNDTLFASGFGGRLTRWLSDPTAAVRQREAGQRAHRRRRPAARPGVPDRAGPDRRREGPQGHRLRSRLCDERLRVRLLHARVDRQQPGQPIHAHGGQSRSCAIRPASACSSMASLPASSTRAGRSPSAPTASCTCPPATPATHPRRSCWAT